MMTTLLIVHGLLSVALLGAITHQALAVVWPPRDVESFTRRFRAVSAPAYTNAVIALFIISFILGSVIYPAYRLNVRPYLEDYRLLSALGAFEIKEHFAAIALALLPLYGLLWHRAAPRAAGAATIVDDGTARGWSVARAAVTVLIALAVWTSFLVGHILNNIRGLFGA